MAISYPALLAFILGAVLLPLIFSRLVRIETIKRRHAMAAVASAFFALIGFVAAYFIFASALSIAMIAFASLMLLPYIIKILEEEKVSRYEKLSVRNVFRTHEKLTMFYIFLFVGMAIEFAILFAVLPPGIGNAAFETQMAAIGPAGSFFDAGLFADILANNMQILIIAFVLSLFYGAGSILVLSYNASIAGVLYGSTFRALIWGTPAFVGNILLYLPHTIIEILAYLLAAVAGGILVKGITRDRVKDASVIFVMSAILIIIAAVVEVSFPLSA